MRTGEDIESHKFLRLVLQYAIIPNSPSNMLSTWISESYDTKLQPPLMNFPTQQKSGNYFKEQAS